MYNSLYYSVRQIKGRHHAKISWICPDKSVVLIERQLVANVYGQADTSYSCLCTVVEVTDDSRPLRRAAFYMEISNNDLGQFYHTQRPHLRTARCAHAASPTRLSIGYWFSVIFCNAISTFISADFLIVFNVLFNFQFKRTRVVVKKLIMVALLCNTRVSVRLSVFLSHDHQQHCASGVQMVCC